MKQSISQRHLDKLAHQAGQLRRRHHLHKTDAGATACWLAGVKTEYIPPTVSMMTGRRRGRG